mgnify:CR=1 FL=1
MHLVGGDNKVNEDWSHWLILVMVILVMTTIVMELCTHHTHVHNSFITQKIIVGSKTHVIHHSFLEGWAWCMGRGSVFSLELLILYYPTNTRITLSCSLFVLTLAASWSHPLLTDIRPYTYWFLYPQSHMTIGDVDIYLLLLGCHQAPHCGIYCYQPHPQTISVQIITIILL